MKRSWRDSEQFWRCCSCVYVLIETSHALQCVCAKGKGASHKLYYQRIWVEHSGQQISEGDQLYHSMLQHSSATANRNKYNVLTLHRHFLLACYLSRQLFRWAWAVTEQYDRERNIERSVTRQWWWLREFSLQKVSKQRGTSPGDSGMAICLPHEAASRVACRRACILICLICNTLGLCRFIKKYQKSSDQSVDL